MLLQMLPFDFRKISPATRDASAVRRPTPEQGPGFWSTPIRQQIATAFGNAPPEEDILESRRGSFGGRVRDLIQSSDFPPIALARGAFDLLVNQATPVDALIEGAFGIGGAAAAQRSARKAAERAAKYPIQRNRRPDWLRSQNRRGNSPVFTEEDFTQYSDRITPEMFEAYKKRNPELFPDEFPETRKALDELRADLPNEDLLKDIQRKHRAGEKLTQGERKALGLDPNTLSDYLAGDVADDALLRGANQADEFRKAINELQAGQVGIDDILRDFPDATVGDIYEAQNLLTGGDDAIDQALREALGNDYLEALTKSRADASEAPIFDILRQETGISNELFRLSEQLHFADNMIEDVYFPQIRQTHPIPDANLDQFDRQTVKDALIEKYRDIFRRQNRSPEDLVSGQAPGDIPGISTSGKGVLPEGTFEFNRFETILRNMGPEAFDAFLALNQRINPMFAHRLRTGNATPVSIERMIKQELDRAFGVVE